MPDPDATAIWSAVAAVAGDCNITPSQMAHALEAARPLIDAEATARERQRIRQLAIEKAMEWQRNHGLVDPYAAGGGDRALRWFADLLNGDGDD